MSDKTNNNQAQQQQQPMPWASQTQPWQQQQAYQYWPAANGYNGISQFPQNFNYGQPTTPYLTEQQQQQRLAYANAEIALKQNGINHHGSMSSFNSTAVTSPNNAMNQQPSSLLAGNVIPLPPGPPPPLNGQSSYTAPALPRTNTSTANTCNQGGGFYGQSPNTGYPHMQYSMQNNKVGLGFKPMNFNNNANNNQNNSGGAKKKRKKNKMARGFPTCFDSGGTLHTFAGNQPPLPKEVPPPFPPLPPPPPSEPPPPPVSPMAKPSTPNNTMSQQGKYNASPLLPTPTKKWNETTSYMVTDEQWPDNLKAYVTRCYAQCVKELDKDQVDIILKGKITTASKDGSLWARNWDFEPLPSLFSERNTIELKKFPIKNNMPKNSPAHNVQRGPPGFAMGKRGRGLSASMGSRLGGFGRGQQQRRSKSRSFSPSGRLRKNRSRSKDGSRSPHRRIKKERRSSDSSSSRSSDENFKPLEPAKKKRGGGRMGSAGFSQAPMSKRAKRKQKQDSKAKNHFYSEMGTIGDVPVNNERLQKRAARFQATMKNSANSVPTKGRKKTLNLNASNSSGSFYHDTTISDVDWKKFHIVGTCMDIDKQYLRQTTAPDASTIRPVEVLRKSLVAVQERWKKDSDYFFACDRMKSIRLDLTLQGVRNDFTVKVYETHARIALEKGDHQELNQCLAQLTQLYAEVGGANRLEFIAYGIHYYVFTKDTLELTTLLARLSDTDKADECVAHAIGVRTAWITNDYHRFFKLYKAAPKMAGYAMELFVERERLTALKIMVKAYRPVLPVSYVTTELGFESPAKCLEFLAPLALAFADPLRTSIECKTSAPIIAKC